MSGSGSGWAVISQKAGRVYDKKYGIYSILETKQGVVHQFIWSNPYEAGSRFLVYCLISRCGMRGVFNLLLQKVRQRSLFMIFSCLLKRNYFPSQVIVTLIGQAYNHQGVSS